MLARAISGDLPSLKGMSLWSLPLFRDRERQADMAVTGIQLVYNDSSDELMFVKLEGTSNNRYLGPNKDTSVGDCWVPWCGSHEDFLKKVIIIVNRFQKVVVGYIWQDKDKNGDDRVRFGTTGWEAPTVNNRIPGFSNVDKKINLRIDGEGKVSAEESSV
jgi:hypothetical protein